MLDYDSPAMLLLVDHWAIGKANVFEWITLDYDSPATLLHSYTHCLGPKAPALSLVVTLYRPVCLLYRSLWIMVLEGSFEVFEVSAEYSKSYS